MISRPTETVLWRGLSWSHEKTKGKGNTVSVCDVKISHQAISVQSLDANKDFFFSSIATVLVKSGILKKGSIIVSNQAFAKVIIVFIKHLYMFESSSMKLFLIYSLSAA